MSKINILGFDISIIDQASLAGAVERFLHSRRQHCIVTPNPEIILKAMRDEELYFIISKADLALPDGIGLKIAALAMGKIIDRHTGADLVKTIFESAQAGGFKAAIAYWEHSISTGREIEHSVKSRWPKLELKAFKVKRQNYMKELDRPALDEIARYNPAVLITNLGAPYQEKFIYHYQRKLPSVKLAVGVGGALDFLTGKMKRAPAVMRKIGLEWLFRLIQEPHRFNRIINAVVVFPYEFLKWRFVNPFFYRPNVACLLYKIINGEYHILIVERTDQPGHWQLPQGGTDGMDLASAGYAELYQEINCDDFDFVAAFPNLYKYRLDRQAGCANGSKFKMRGYKGQKQGLYIAEFTGSDADIRVNFWEHRDWKWVEKDRLISEVHPTRREAARIFLGKLISTAANVKIIKQKAI